MVKHKGDIQRSQPTIRKSTTTAVAMEVDPPPPPRAAKRPVKKTQKKRELRLCPLSSECPNDLHRFTPQALLSHMRSKHRKNPRAPARMKEIGVHVALEAAGIECEHMQYLEFPYYGINCERGAWADFGIRTHWGIVLLQIDEHQHAHQPPERDLTRDCKTYEGFGGQKVAILRYNPDVFHIDGQSVQVETEERHRRLVEVLHTWLAKDYVPEKPFQRFFLYYDGESGSKLPLAAEAWCHKFSAAISMRA